MGEPGTAAGEVLRQVTAQKADQSQRAPLTDMHTFVQEQMGAIHTVRADEDEPRQGDRVGARWEKPPWLQPDWSAVHQEMAKTHEQNLSGNERRTSRHGSRGSIDVIGSPQAERKDCPRRASHARADLRRWQR